MLPRTPLSEGLALVQWDGPSTSLRAGGREGPPLRNTAATLTSFTMLATEPGAIDVRPNEVSDGVQS